MTLNERIYNVLFTTKGSVPYRPHFGSDILEYIDKPINVAIPNIKRAIVDSLTKNIPDLQVKRVTNSGLEFTIEFENLEKVHINLDAVRDYHTIRLDYNQGDFTIRMVYDGDILQSPVLSVNTALVWLKENWSVYGKWIVLNNVILFETTFKTIRLEINNA